MAKQISKIKLELEKIEARYGVITPQVVVKEASNPKSPLHKSFTWDNTKAASEYRLWQARQIIREVMIIREEVSQPVRAFTSVVFSAETQDGDDSRAYVSTERALKDKDMRKQILARAKREAEEWASKYEALQELAAIVKAIRWT